MPTFPKIAHVDVVVIGGTTSAVSAALKLKKEGLSVYLLAGRTYLGEDVCDSLRLILPKDLRLDHPLTHKLYSPFSGQKFGIRPLHVKLELERSLREANIPYLYSTLPGEILVDEDQNITGICVCNRSGRQILTCRAILDGSLRGEVLRMAQVPLSPPPKNLSVQRRVIAGEQPDANEGSWEAEGLVEYLQDKEIQASTLWCHSSESTIKDGSWQEWMTLEQSTRMISYRPGQHLSADGIFVRTREQILPAQPAQKLEANYHNLASENVSVMGKRLWLTGLSANIQVDEEWDILRHDNAIDWGEKVAELMLKEIPHSLKLGQQSLSIVKLPENIEVCEIVDDLRWRNGEQVAFYSQGFTAIHEVDVLVVGGGTGGAPAAISAAKAGAKTLVVEFCAGLGGVGTVGMIGVYWFGNKVGFTAKIDREVAAKSPLKVRDNAWDVEAKMQWYHEQVTQYGGSVWYKSMNCGALKMGNKVVGAIIATPQGRIAVKAKCVVDATGCADVAAAAGAQTVRIGAEHIALQGTGLPPRCPGAYYTNTDYDFIDDTEPQDATGAFTCGKEKFSSEFDMGQLIDSRERRRIVGDIEITPMDIRLARIFPDTINKAYSNFDTHGFTIHPFFMLLPPDHSPLYGNIPLRALLPKGLEGILVTGLGISAHRDAMPVLRMQGDVQNQGYAAGLAAAWSMDGHVRQLDIRKLQNQLILEGLLDESMAEAKDSFPLDENKIMASIQSAAESFDHLDPAFTLPQDELIERMIEAYDKAETNTAKEKYAHILGILGNATGLITLKNLVKNSPWDKGWNYRGMGQFGFSMSPLDSQIIALGRCGDQEALSILINKARDLPSEAEFSHYRALAEAFETLGDVQACQSLESLLNRDQICGHAQIGVQQRLHKVNKEDRTDTLPRNASLIEIHLLRALVKLSPQNERARTMLENYSRDERAIFARHAKSILNF